MSRFQIGAAVRLARHYPEEFLPPVGVVGTIVGPLDWMGDHAVFFPGYPCEAGPGTDWEVPASQLEPAVLQDDRDIASAMREERLRVLSQSPLAMRLAFLASRRA